MKEETKVCKKERTKGITLIALIITIIVMLILVGVTISVALNGGLISKAQEAKTKTEEAQIQERDLLTGRIKIGDTWYDSLDEYLKNNPSENQSDGMQDEQGGEIGGTAEWEQDDEGNITYAGKDTGLKVGDYVDYEKYVITNGDKTKEVDGLYEELTTYSGFTDNSNNVGKTYSDKYPLEKEELKWRVLDIKDGQIRLISDTPTESKVCLYGYNGYNNAVYLIDKVCNTLYTTEKGTAQNLKIEDIEEKMNLEIWDYHNQDNSYVDTKKYEGTKEYSGDYSYYPEIFEKEKKGYILDKEKDTYIEGTLLDLSEQTEPIKQSAPIPASPTSNDKIKITLTYWLHTMEEENWVESIYQYLFIKDSSGSWYSTYWLSSRCVAPASTDALFYVRYVNYGGVNACRCYRSKDTSDNNTYCLRPLVCLAPSVKIGEKVGDTFTIK